MKYDFEMDIDESTSVGKIAAHIKEGTHILEFGPGNGRMTKHLMGKKKCEVSIVELDKELYDYVSQIATDSFYGNIEDYTWVEHFAGKKFDYILFADVLEHLMDPKKTLEMVKEFLKDDGEILITFPNIAHNSVLINLFNNKLEWTKYGLLDATHKTFFTQAGFEKVFNEAGLFIQREDFTFNEVGNNELSAHYEDLPLELHYAFRMRPYGEVYQYFFALKKHPVEKPEVAVLENHNFIKSMKIVYQFADHVEEKVKKINSYTNENSVFTLEVPAGVEQVLFYPFPENLGGVISFYAEANDQELETLTSSAVFSDDNKYLFTNMAAAYLTVSGSEVAGKEVSINVSYDFQGQYYLELNKLMLDYQAVNTEKENLVRRYNQVLAKQVEFNKTPLKKFVHEVSFSIDEVKRNSKTDTTTIKGWAFDNQDHQSFTFDVAADNSPIVSTRVIDRPDVAEQFDLENERLGFEIDIYDPNRRKSFDLILASATQAMTYGVVIDAENASYLPIKKQSKARKFASSIKHRGIMGTANHILKRSQQQNAYENWIAKNEVFDQTAIQQEIAGFAFQPKISIVVPVYNVEEKWLDACISSLKNQFYSNWELCLADDASPKEYIKPLLKKYAAEDDRIKLVFREKNGHISEATNSALEIATGEYIGFMDNDDELAPNALYEIVKALNKDQSIDFFYTDEDKMNQEGKRYDAFFKPDWNPVLIMQHNYITHFVVIKRELQRKVGGLKTEYNGSQDYDFVLRATEAANNIHHVRKILYHWRAIESSTALNPESKNYAYVAGKRTLEAALNRRGMKGSVKIAEFFGCYQINYDFEKQPFVSVIIPAESKHEQENIRKLLNRTHYQNYEVLHQEKQMTESNTRLRFVEGDLNQMIAQAKGEYMIVLDKELVPQNAKWIEELLNYGQLSSVGLTTGKVIDMNNKIENIGVSLDLDKDRIICPEVGAPEKNLGYYYRIALPRNIQATTGGCALFSKTDFDAVNGFDLTLSAELSWIDFSLKIGKLNKQVVYTSYAKVRRTMKFDQTEVTMDQLMKKWPEEQLLDPYGQPVSLLDN